MRPETFKRPCPFIQRPDGLGVRSIQHLPPIPTHPHQPNLPQHPQMLRYRRLFQPKPGNDRAHGAFLASQVIQNLPPPRFSHRIKSIRSSRRPCHATTLYSYIGICQAQAFSLPIPAPVPVRRRTQTCHPERSTPDRVRSGMRSRGTLRFFPSPPPPITFFSKNAEMRCRFRHLH